MKKWKIENKKKNKGQKLSGFNLLLIMAENYGIDHNEAVQYGT